MQVTLKFDKNNGYITCGLKVYYLLTYLLTYSIVQSLS